jgi:enamine deaminase RidA (YjgF/YER057c/UK114 family)
MNTNIENRLSELNLVLPPAPKPLGVYKPVVVAGSFLYVSGQGPMRADGSLIIGRVGDNLTLEDGKAAARQVGLTMLSTIKSQIGDLSKLKRLVKVLGMVNCTPEFSMHPAVINGFSELMSEVFGEENGVGVRSAVGMFLPAGIAVEIEAMFELHEGSDGLPVR